MNVARRFRGIVAVGLLLIIVSTATAKYSGGSGTAQDPYQIATAADLIALGETPEDYDKHFVLTADIDLAPNLPGRKVFDKAVIGTLTGVFDGNGHTVSHLTVEGGGHLGLFGELRIGAEVRDLGVVDVHITASDDYTGALVGTNGGTLTGCYSTGVVRGREDVGGLVGDNWGPAAQCYSACVVSGGNGVGGLMGENSNGTVNNCYSTGAVYGTGWAGGLTPYNQGTVTLCFWDIQTSGQAKSAAGAGKTTAEMQTARTFLEAGWDFVGETTNGSEDIWKIAEGLGYPRLSWEKYSGGTGEPNDPYQIATAADLIALGETPADYSKSFILTADIDLDPNLPGCKVFDKAVIAPDIAPGTGIRELGFQGNGFTGIFDGKGHTISHLTLDGGDYLGLLGCLSFGAEVKNLGVVDVNIIGSGGCVGGLVGWNGGSMTRCSHSGLVSASWEVGGLVGQSRGDVTDCHSIGAVRGKGDVGGLVGFNYGGAVARCYGGGTVSGTGDSGNGIGGLVGQNWGFVTRCYSTGAARGGAKVGGLVGGNGGEVTDCYSMDKVAGGSSIGGLVGVNWAYGRGGDPGGPPVILPGLVARCYSTGQVTGTEDRGGLVGSNKYADEHETIEGAVSGGCWDIQTSGQTQSAGGTGLTTVEMQVAKTFLDAGWDFVGETANGSDDVWKVAEGLGYPRLSWQKYSGGTGEPNDPYQIATAADVIALGETPEDYDKHFILTADIDLDPNLPGRRVFDKAVIAPDTNDATGGFQGTPFTGVFDGNDHRLHNYSGNQALFGCVRGSSAEVKNLGLFKADVKTTRFARGDVNSTTASLLVGDLTDGTVSNCHVQDCNLSNWSIWGAGGLVLSNNGTIADCHIRGQIMNTGHWTGGLAAVNGVAGTITRCSFSGSVRGGSGNFTGGLVGQNYGGISFCYSTGSVPGLGDCIGGLVGDNCGVVYSCYSTSDVGGGGGGLVGYHRDPGIVSNCYSAGRVPGDFPLFRAAGLVRHRDGGIVTASFWDIETSGQKWSDGGVGLTTVQMHTTSIFLDAAWDFAGETANGTEDIWWILEGKDYPRLWWEARDEASQ
jgi:hypothetical protein